MMKINNNPFRLALENNEMFEFLIGDKGYEIKFYIANMPTDVSMVTYFISKYITDNSDFDKNKIINAFFELSKSIEWSWLLVYYTSSFLRKGMDFLPLDLLYKNLQENKEYLLNNNGWLCFNFRHNFNNLWDIIVNENKKQKMKFNVPNLK